MKLTSLLSTSLLLTIFLTINGSTGFTDITDGLSVRLTLDNTSQDATGSHHATFHNEPTFVKGKIGSHALLFDGVNDYAVLAQTEQMTFGPSGDFTVSLWIKSGGWQSDPPVITNKAWKSGKNPGWGLFLTGDGKWKVNAGNGDKRADRDGGLVNDYKWHHIAVAFKRDAHATLYQDGLRIDSMNVAQFDNLTTGLPIVIGQDGPQKYPAILKGALDDVCIWNRALNQREIWDIYITGEAGLEFTVPQNAKTTLPDPKNESQDIHTACTVYWRGAKDAVSYDVYLDSDHGGVDRADKTSAAYKTTTSQFNYAPPRLKMGTTYYWRIDAVSGDGSVTRGDVWGFQTKRDAVAQWLFVPSPDGSPVVRDSRNNRHGQIKGTILYKQNPGALVFDGQTNEVEIADFVSISMFSQPEITVEAWVYIDRTGGDPRQDAAIAAASRGNPNDWRLGYKDFAFYFAVFQNGQEKRVASTTFFSTNRWYHVAASYDGVTLKIYVNGQLVNKTVSPAAPGYEISSPNFIGVFSEKGQIHRFKGRIHEVRLFDRPLADDEIQAAYDAKQSLFPGSIEMAFGPYLQFTGPHSAIVRWKTHTPNRTFIEYGLRSTSENVSVDPALKTSHEFIFTNLKFQKKYFYTIKTIQDGEIACTPIYECDNFFNYSLPEIPGSESNATATSLAKFILQESKINKGYCLVIGCDDTELLSQLARQSDLYIHAVDTDPQKAARARTDLMRHKIYGVRVTARQVDSYTDLPFTNYFANLIVANRETAKSIDENTAMELFRIQRPAGGKTFLEASPDDLDWFTKESKNNNLTIDHRENWIIFTRHSLPGIGEWSHQYGKPDNSANGGETLLGATETDDLEVQWIGRPGARAMVDRNPRKPAPLSTNGRLFTQGLNRIIAQDAYNGTILWSLENPALERYNMPRDCGNWCADDDFIYAAIRDRCWKIDAQTGTLVSVFDTIPPANIKEPFDWGYIARSGNKLFGSAVKAKTAYTNFWGGSDTGWADAQSGPITFKVCSDTLFALDPANGKTAWTYSHGVLINPTITIAGGKVYFVECRNEKVKASAPRRVGLPELWDNQFLVALNANTGALEWEQPIDTEDGIIVFYLLYTDKTLLLAASNTQYHLYAFDAADGRQKWTTSHQWINDNHGQHMQHPAIVGDTVYLRPRGYRVTDGAQVTANMPPHEGGCATFAATTGALLYRGKEGAISLWDVEKEAVTHWFSLRPDCWLSTIPASGMVLSPEGGGGCSCGGWLETSLGFILSQSREKGR